MTDDQDERQGDGVSAASPFQIPQSLQSVPLDNQAPSQNQAPSPVSASSVLSAPTQNSLSPPVAQDWSWNSLISVIPSSSNAVSDEDRGVMSEESSGASVYSRGKLFRKITRVQSGTFFDRVRVKQAKPIRKVGARQNRTLGIYSVDETKRIFRFLYDNQFLNFMKGSPVSDLMSHLNASAKHFYH